MRRHLFTFCTVFFCSAAVVLSAQWLRLMLAPGVPDNDPFIFQVVDQALRTDVRLSDRLVWIGLLCVPPLIAIAQLHFARMTWRLREARAAGSVCVNCGYDLRATPDRCPECGTAKANA